MATLASELDLPQITLADGNYDQRHALRLSLGEDQWLVRNLFGYAVLHYEDATAVLRDKRWHSATSKIPELMGITNPAFLERQQVSILSAEGDVHQRLRRLVAPAFSPRAADRLRPFMREVINGLVDDVAGAGRADFTTDICEPYPIPIICELLGAPKQDWQLFSRWASDILEIFSIDVVDKLDVIMKAQEELGEYTRGLISVRRNSPADDLLTDLIAAEEAGDKLSNDELVMMVNAVIVGGTDTTRNQLGCAVALFAEHPQQWVLLAEQPGLAPRAVEEAMRYFGAVRGTARFASCDIEYRDVVFPAGTFICRRIGRSQPRRGGVHPTRSIRHHVGPVNSAAADLRLRHPLLLGGRPGPRRTAGGAAIACPAHAEAHRRRHHHLEARRRRHLRARTHADHLRHRSLNGEPPTD